MKKYAQSSRLSDLERQLQSFHKGWLANQIAKDPLGIGVLLVSGFKGQRGQQHPLDYARINMELTSHYSSGVGVHSMSKLLVITAELVTGFQLAGVDAFGAVDIEAAKEMIETYWKTGERACWQSTTACSKNAPEFVKRWMRTPPFRISPFREVTAWPEPPSLSNSRNDPACGGFPHHLQGEENEAKEE